MRTIVKLSLRFRWIVLFLAAATLALGFVQIPDTKVDVFPEFAPPEVEIQTIAVGNSSEEVEQLITVPIEDQLGGIEGLAELRSKSVAQLSSIRLIFERGADELKARQLVQERLSQITPTLPTWASPPFMMPALSATSRILKIGITSDTISPTDLSEIAYWKIRARLLRVPGVAQVAIYGERLPQRHIQVDPKKLAEHNVTLRQVMDAGADAVEAGLMQYTDGAVVGTGGFIEEAGQRFNIRHVQPIVDPEQIGKIPVVERDGKVIRMGDLGRVVIDSGPLIGDGVVDDGFGLLLIVQKYRGANTVEVTRGVEEAMQQMQPGLPGVTVDTTIFRPTTFIEQSLDNLRTAMLLGIGLVALIIIAFLFEWRTAFISLIAIPLSLVAAVLILDAGGVTVNVMVLAGLVVAIGVVVDDAIIDVENVVRRLRQAQAEGSTASTFSIVLHASVEVRSAITYATVINVIAVVPVLFLAGLSGSFFRPLVLSYALAVLVSMVVALTVTPALCLLLLSRGKLGKESPLMRVLKRAYGAVLAPLIRRPLPAMALTLALLVGGLLAVPTLGSQLLPNFKERDFLMHWLTEPSTSVTEETRVSVLACKDLKEIEGVRNCGSHIGQAFLADEIYGVYFGENWISVSPEVDYDETLDKVHRVVESYPGLYRDVQTYLRERIKEVLTGASESIVVRVYGPDLAELQKQSKIIEERIGDIAGVEDAHASLQTDLPHIEVETDLAKARAVGLTPGDIRRQTSALIASEEVSDIFARGRAYDVHVTVIPTARDSVTDVENMQLDTPSGRKVMLKDVATVKMGPTPNAVLREEQSRYIDVGANVASGHALNQVVDDVEQRMEGVVFPLGYHAEVIGESTELDAAEDTLLAFGIAAGVATLLLLHVAFGSFRPALLTFVLLPMALVGGAIAVWMSGRVLSLGSLVGFLAVFGIAARNGILMISHFERLEREEGVKFGPGLVLQGAKERLAPIMMTALATGLALVPLVVAGSIPGHEIEHPMAIVILGGLVTATLVNLFVLPSLYLAFGKSRREKAELKAADEAPAAAG
jgi:CzcA family heavy metal efflux pump